MIRYPARVKSPKVIKSAYSSPDFAPTILGLMNVDYSSYKFQGIDGSDEILSDTEVTAREQVRFISDSRKARWAAAVDRQYKLVLSKKDSPWLFDLEKDPDEMINYASYSSYSDIMKKLQEKLINAMEQYALPLIDVGLVYIDPPVCSDVKDQIPDAPYRVCGDLRKDMYKQICIKEEVSKFCPTSCGLCCKDSTGNMYLGGKLRDCNFVKEKKDRCSNEKVKKFCPLTCLACIPEAHVRPPTDIPTIFASDKHHDSPSNISPPIPRPSQQTNDAPIITYAVATCGFSKKIGPEYCDGHEKFLHRSEKAAVRCCSDTPKSRWIKHDGCNVWVTSRIQDRCYLNKTWLDAKAICEGVAARLCTTEEVSTDCTQKTGCRANVRWIWTSSLKKASRY